MLKGSHCASQKPRLAAPAPAPPWNPYASLASTGPFQWAPDVVNEQYNINNAAKAQAAADSLILNGIASADRMLEMEGRGLDPAGTGTKTYASNDAFRNASLWTYIGAYAPPGLGWGNGIIEAPDPLTVAGQNADFWGQMRDAADAGQWASLHTDLQLWKNYITAQIPLTDRLGFGVWHGSL